jgi:hypothetical protein
MSVELRAVASAVAVTVACTQAPAESPAAAQPDRDGERADALAELDPGFEAPPPASVGHDSDRIIVLQSPRGQSGVREALAAFFSAVARESGPDLAKTLSGNAMSHFATGRSMAALTGWMRRFAQDDYHVLEQYRLPGPAAIETYTSEEVRRLSALRDFQLQPSSDEVLAVIHVDSVPLLGNTMLFLLKPTDEGYEIRATYEDTTRL